MSAAVPALPGSRSGPRLVVGVDVGGTKTAAMLVRGSLDVQARATMPTTSGAQAGAVVRLILGVLAQAGVEPRDVDAVGVGLPGHVDPLEGTVRMAVNVGGQDEPIARLVSEALGVPCFIEHDARAAVRWLAELDGGAHRGLGFVSIGTGISAGIVLDGRPVTGAHGLAGEIGHVVAVPNGPTCGCGLRGCLEAVASGPAIVRLARAAAAREGSTIPMDATAADIFRAAANGEMPARRVIDDAAAALARAIRGLVLSFGLDQVILGGGVARAGNALMEPLLAALAAERDASSLVRELLRDSVVRRQPADPDAGTWGAVSVARDGWNTWIEAPAVGREEVDRRDLSTPSL